MQSIFKKSYLKSLPKSATVNVVSGKPVATWETKGGKTRKAPVCKRKDGSLAVRLERNVYMARFRDASGKVVERSTGCRSKDTAKAKLAEFVRDAERVAVGVVTTEELEVSQWLHSSIGESIEDYTEYQRAKGNHPDRINFTKQHLITDAAYLDWTVLGDLSVDKLQSYYDDLKIAGDGAGSLNGRVSTWVAFGNWLAGKRIRDKRARWNGEKRVASNPFEGLGRYDATKDCRRKRRALGEVHLRKLLKVAEERPLKDAKTIRSGPNKGKLLAKVNSARIPDLLRLGQERALIYKTLILTGLRKGELESVSVAFCVLEDDLPHIQLVPKHEKNGKGNKVPLRDDLAAELKQWIADTGRQESDPLFDIPAGLLRILNRDLKAAGIDKIDSQGRSVDVHALRHSFGTLLSTSKVAPRIAQKAMRHSNLSLTMKVYTDESLLDARGAVNSLPDLSAAGSDGLNENEPKPPKTSRTRNSRRAKVPPKQCTTPALEAEEGLVPPNVPPRTSPSETIQDNKRSLDDAFREVVKQEKPRENIAFPELSSVGLTGFEPATSTPPV